MRLFLSFASEDRQLAERIYHALQGCGYTTFFDRSALPPGDEFNSRIEAEVSRADLFVFLVSPESVREQSYALTELLYASRKWPSPRGRVVPVRIREISYDKLPAYLSQVTVLQPVGNVEAETVMAVKPLARQLQMRQILKRASVAIGLSMVVGAGWYWSKHRTPSPRDIGGAFAYSPGRWGGVRACGAAILRDGNLELTSRDKIDQVGAVWYPQRVRVTSGFQTTFEFGVRRNENVPGADGLAFVIQADRADAIGNTGGNLGYNGIKRSLAVEFDMIKNGDLSDPNSNHVSIQTRYEQPNSANHSRQVSIGYSQPLNVTLADGFLHAAYVDYKDGIFNVYVDDRSAPVVTTELDLRNVVGSESGWAWVGLTAASGGYTQGHYLRSWKLDADEGFEDEAVSPGECRVIPEQPGS